MNVPADRMRRAEESAERAVLPDASEVVIRYLLERNAREEPDEAFVTFEDGSRWTRQGALNEAYRAANVLRAAGVRQEDRVAIFLRNGPDFLRAWWGANALGAAIIPVNAAYRGAMLSHVLDVTTPATVVVADEFRSRLDDIGDRTSRLEPLALANGTDQSLPGLDRSIEIWDVHSIAFTSGTTGRSKASLITHRHLFQAGSWGPTAFHLDANDVFLVDLPLFHMAGKAKVVASVAARSKLAVRTAPAMTSYWETAKTTGATAAGMISSMAAFLLTQPERPADRDHSLRLVISAPLPADHEAFMARFGIQEMTTGYGSTEVSAALVRAPDMPLVRGSCGRVRDGYEVRLVDDHDLEVRDGALGELVVRTDQPWCLSAGYVGDPAATAAAWRNGWFHTGDMFHCDAEGNYYFHDRCKDALRRRGENISSFEVEREVLAFPGIAEVACVAVQCEGQPDDEVKVFLVPEEVLDLESLVRFLVGRMPHFMVPRYYEVVDELPKTATMRVEKHRLRALGNTASTWDCQASGLKVTATGLIRG